MNKGKRVMVVYHLLKIPEILISLRWRLMRGNIIEKRLLSFAFEKTPRIRLSCKLAPVQYREYEYGLLTELVRCDVT